MATKRPGQPGLRTLTMGSRIAAWITVRNQATSTTGSDWLSTLAAMSPIGAISMPVVMRLMLSQGRSCLVCAPAGAFMAGRFPPRRPP